MVNRTEQNRTEQNRTEQNTPKQNRVQENRSKGTICDLLRPMTTDHHHDTSTNKIQSNPIKSNQIKSNQIKSNQIKSNQIKPNHIVSYKTSHHIEVRQSQTLIYVAC
jgi:hypothetical protein